MKRGDLVKGQAMWPRNAKFEWVYGPLALAPFKDSNSTVSWIQDHETHEFRAVHAATVQLLVPSLSQEPDPVPTIRARVLDEAKRITARDRNSAYGEPEDNFQRIADLWNIFLGDRLKDGEALTQGDTAALMILVKIAREMNAPSEDNKVDIAGYAACWAQVDHRE